MSRIDDLIRDVCPNGVPSHPLSEIVEVNRGGGTPARSRDDFWGGNIPWASVGDLSVEGIHIADTRQRITEAGLENSSTNLISRGDVIIAVKIAPGKAMIAGRDMAINQDLRGLTLKDSVLSKFLVYYLQTISVGGSGTIVKGISNKLLMKTKIPVPPLEVQDEIVRILDNFSALTAELEAELEARRAQYEYYRDALLQGEYAPDSVWATLGDIGSVAMCKRIFKNQTAPEGEVPFFKIGTFGKEPDAFIDRGLFNEYREKYQYPKLGDVLISASGTIGRAIVYDGADSYYQDSNIVWLAHDEERVLNRYLYHWYKIIEWATDTGGTIRRLYNKNILKARILLPTLAEQERIADVLDRFETLTTDLTSGLPAEIEARRKQYEHYRDRLLTFEEVTS